MLLLLDSYIFKGQFAPFLSGDSIFSLNKVDKLFHKRCQELKKTKILSQRIRKHMFEYGFGDNFWRALKESNAVISGSFLLSCITNDKWIPGDIDIFQFESNQKFNCKNIKKDDRQLYDISNSEFLTRSDIELYAMSRHGSQDDGSLIMNCNNYDYETPYVRQYKKSLTSKNEINSYNDVTKWTYTKKNQYYEHQMIDHFDTKALKMQIITVNNNILDISQTTIKNFDFDFNKITFDGCSLNVYSCESICDRKIIIYLPTNIPNTSKLFERICKYTSRGFSF